MRLWASLMVIASNAEAAPFVEAGVGVREPLGGERWKGSDPAPKLFVRAGVDGGVTWIGGIDVSWLRLDGSVDRVRLQGGARWAARRGRRVIVTRLMTGIELLRTDGRNASGSLVEVTSPGLAIELVTGAWQRLGAIELGLEMGFAVAFHRTLRPVTVEHTSVDFDVLLGARFVFE